jgi:hypothetical protein
MKDTRAEIEQIEAGLKSRTQALAERGFDAEQVDAEIAADRAREQKLGLLASRPTRRATRWRPGRKVTMTRQLVPTDEDPRARFCRLSSMKLSHPLLNRLGSRRRSQRESSTGCWPSG